jgi:T5SS/PEP-CTERM-associated repeat protein
MQSRSQIRVPGAHNRQAKTRVSPRDASFASRGRYPAFRRQALAVAVASLLLAGMTPWDTTAATRTWDGGGPNGNWNSSTATLNPDFSITYATNWTGTTLSGIPVNGDSLVFAGSTRRSNTNTHLSSINDLTFASNAGAFTLGGDGLTVTGAIKNLSNNIQTINLPITVGATANIWDGGTKGINLKGGFTLGSHQLTLNNKIAIDTGGGDFYVGRNDYGANITLAGGSSIIARQGLVGTDLLSGTATARVTGAGSTWTNSGVLSVGYRSTGYLDIQNGGQVISSHSRLGLFDAESAYGPAGIGVASVTGAGSKWTINGDLDVGFYGGQGYLSIRDGGRVSNVNGFIADLGGGGSSSSTVTVDGVGSEWINSGDLRVGTYNREITGHLNIRNGGKVAAASLVFESEHSTVHLNDGTLSLLNGPVLRDGSYWGASDGGFKWTKGTLSYTNSASMTSSWALAPGMILGVGNTLTIGRGVSLVGLPPAPNLDNSAPYSRRKPVRNGADQPHSCAES